MKVSLISLVLTALLVINSVFQSHQNNKLQVAADSTYENILSVIALQNNTGAGANGCTRPQCQVIDDDEADLFMDHQAAGSSRMLAGTMPIESLMTGNRNRQAGCRKVGPDGKYTTCIGGGSPQLGCKSQYCEPRLKKNS
jgi:hypothetical protein